MPMLGVHKMFQLTIKTVSFLCISLRSIVAQKAADFAVS
jgi:hypothetical protein